MTEQELLAKIAELERKNSELEQKQIQLESRMNNIEDRVNTINGFVSAITESLTVEQTMNEIESAARQLTNADKVTFYCMDKTNDKFFSQGDSRNWQNAEISADLKNAFESQNIENKDNSAIIPLVTADGKSLGVIVAEKENGFTPKDLDNFKPGEQFVSSVKLGLEKEYQHQGRITDELTQMFNRQGLNEHLVNTVIDAYEQGKSVNILMSDIDHFKQVNDTYGHDAGDIILKGVADTLKDFTREGANACFRMGGEEMVCILITDTPEEARDMAETLRQNVEDRIHDVMQNGEPKEVKVTVSIGMHEMKPETLMTPQNAREVFDTEFKKADEAVYDAKESGRNKVVTHDENVNLKYLALKASQIMAQTIGTDVSKEAIDEIKAFAIDCLTCENDEHNHNVLVEALNSVPEQYPHLAESVEFFVNKIEEAFKPAVNEAEKKKEKADVPPGHEENKSEKPRTYNAEAYKTMENKAFVRTDSKTAYKITQEAKKQNVEVSAVFKDGKATVTVDKVKNKPFLDTMVKMVKWADSVQKKAAEKEKAQEEQSQNISGDTR